MIVSIFLLSFHQKPDSGGNWAAFMIAEVIDLAGFDLLLPQSLHRAAIAVIYHHRGFI